MHLLRVVYVIRALKKINIKIDVDVKITLTIKYSRISEDKKSEKKFNCVILFIQ